MIPFIPGNLDADQAKIVRLTLAALAKVEQVRATGIACEADERTEERALDCIQEQMDALDEVEFATLIRALVEASGEAA